MLSELTELRAAVAAVHHWFALEYHSPAYPPGISPSSDAAAVLRRQWREECVRVHLDAARLVRGVVAKYSIEAEEVRS
jgi:hypothetical protein